TPNPSSSSTNATTLGRGEVLVDSSYTRNVDVTGSWTKSSSGRGFIGRDFLMSGKSGGSVTFTPDLPVSGDYWVYVRTISGAGVSAPTKVSIGGKSASVPNS